MGRGVIPFYQSVVGLLKSKGGDIEIFNKPRRRESDFLDVRERVGLLFQDPEDQLFCPTVVEDVAFGPLNKGKTHDEAEAIVVETLELLGLRGYENRITYRLSGGEKRLVSLATVLAMKPEVLLLDEPVSGLDDETTKRIIDILTQLQVTMIVISHDHDFLREVTSKTVEIRDRCIVSRELSG